MERDNLKHLEEDLEYLVRRFIERTQVPADKAWLAVIKLAADRLRGPDEKEGLMLGKRENNFPTESIQHADDEDKKMDLTCSATLTMEPLFTSSAISGDNDCTSKYSQQLKASQEVYDKIKSHSAKGLYRCPDDDNEQYKAIKLNTLSASMANRLSLDVHGQVPKSVAEKILASIDFASKPKASKFEAKCIDALRAATSQNFVHNHSLFTRGDINGTPDSICFGSNGDPLLVAEFKNKSEKAIATEDKTQVDVYLELFQVPCYLCVADGGEEVKCKLITTQYSKELRTRVGKFCSFRDSAKTLKNN